MSFDKDMQSLRTEYQAGDKSALALAILECGHFRKALPLWVAKAWQEGWTDVSMRIADWSTVLGKVRVRTPKQIAREQSKLNQLAKLVKLLPSVRTPIERDGEGAFRELGEKMGIPARAVKELYYMKGKHDGKEFRVLSPLALRRRSAKK